MWHRWMSEDEGFVSCLVCGGLWETDADGQAQAANGDTPTRCTANTSMVHGDPVEQGFEREDVNAQHDCNCARCTS